MVTTCSNQQPWFNMCQFLCSRSSSQHWHQRRRTKASLFENGSEKSCESAQGDLTKAFEALSKALGSDDIRGTILARHHELAEEELSKLQPQVGDLQESWSHEFFHEDVTVFHIFCVSENGVTHPPFLWPVSSGLFSE